MNEPRGHYDMYGAILVQDTEMTERGEADIGVLFCHNGKLFYLQAEDLHTYQSAYRWLLHYVWSRNDCARALPRRHGRPHPIPEPLKTALRQ